MYVLLAHFLINCYFNLKKCWIS